MNIHDLISVYLLFILLPWSDNSLAVFSSEYSKNEIVFPDEPFEYRLNAGLTNMGWIKFTIPKEPDDLGSITYQDSSTYRLHYEFVSRHMDPFIGISPEEFDRISLFEEGQKLILGAVVTPPKGYPLTNTVQELGIQFVRRDHYTTQEIAYLFELVKRTIVADANVTMYYFPTYEQMDIARQNLSWFAEQGIPVSSSARWFRSNVIFSEGWAFGRLKYIPSDQIQATYSKGELLAADILLTDAVPAEIPVVAGIISLSPSTPNSHVAILAMTYEIPFIYLVDEWIVAQAKELVDSEIILRVTPRYEWDTQIDFIKTDGILSKEQADQLRVLKQPLDLNIQPIELSGVYGIPGLCRTWTINGPTHYAQSESLRPLLQTSILCIIADRLEMFICVNKNGYWK